MFLFHHPRITPARVLRLIRDTNAKDFGALLNELQVGSGEESHLLYDIIRELKDKGVITISGGGIETGKYAVTRQWMDIQNLIGINLTRDMTISGGAILATPIFGVPDKLKQADLFVAMPFKNVPRAIYTKHISSVAKTLGLSIARADDFFSARPILTDIWNAISGCRAVVADCTNRNPNVFYEIGIAHTIGKPVILITQQLVDVPFDIQHIRTFQYEYTLPGMKKFEFELEQALRATLAMEELLKSD